MMIFQLNTKEIWKLGERHRLDYFTSDDRLLHLKTRMEAPALWGNMRTGVPRMDFDKIQILLSVVVSCTVCNWHQLADVLVS